jgi:hypothetical protein
MKYLKKYFKKENIPSGDLIRKNVKREDLAGQSSEYVIINSGAGSWMREITFISLLSVNDIRNIFGKEDFNFRGIEFLYRNWGFEFNNETFFLASANGKGTMIESTCTDVNIVKGFFRKLVDEILLKGNDDLRQSYERLEKLGNRHSNK